MLYYLFFIEHFAAQGREGGTECLRLVDHILWRTAIRRRICQTACGDHTVGDGPLLLNDFAQVFLLLRQTQDGDVANPKVSVGCFLQL
ncbi:hypothetical protein D3C86_1863180 [compost metagenome]